MMLLHVDGDMVLGQHSRGCITVTLSLSLSFFTLSYLDTSFKSMTETVSRVDNEKETQEVAEWLKR
jgi:hypothetical protein